MSYPALSIVVTVACVEDHISRCLTALSTQPGAPPMEIIVPLYPALHDGNRLRRQWPGVRFVDMPDDPPPPGSAWHHWKVDRLRAEGLRAARGDVIALLQDNGPPDEHWCAAVWEEHRRIPADVIGGGIRHAAESVLSRAAYYCDFGRYQPPFLAATTDYASVLNVSYKRSAIEKCRDAWENFYDESIVHRRIRESGGSIHLTSSFNIDYKPEPLSFAETFQRKLASGRAFAARRSTKSPGFRRLALAALSPGLAPLMLLRQFRLQRRRGHRLAPFLAAVPLTAACLLFWSFGEWIGYVTARPFPSTRRIDA